MTRGACGDRQRALSKIAPERTTGITLADRLGDRVRRNNQRARNSPTRERRSTRYGALNDTQHLSRDDRQLALAGHAHVEIA
jgi:hypothetical protein